MAVCAAAGSWARPIGRGPGRLLLLLVLAACYSGPQTEEPGLSPSSSKPPDLRVEYAGCREILKGPVCVVPDARRLRLWIATDSDAEVTVNGRSPGESVQVQGGRRLEIDVADGLAEIAVEARRGAYGASWRLALLGDYEVPEWAIEASRLKSRGDLDGARRLAAARLDSPSPKERSFASAWIEHLARVTGAADPTELSLRALRAHREAGRISRAIRSATNAAFDWTHRGELSAARAVLQDLPIDDGDNDSSMRRSYSESRLSARSGDLRTSLRKLEDAGARAARLALSEWWRLTIEQARAAHLLRLGRFAEAEQIFTTLAPIAPEAFDDCELARFLNDRAWGRLLSVEAREPVGDAQPLLEDALLIFDQRCRAFPEERVNVRVNLALSQLHAARPDLARRWLGRARQVASELGIRLAGELLHWILDLEARVELEASEAAGALELYDRLRDLSRKSLAPEAEWRATFGRARTLEALGDASAALAEYALAETLLDQEILTVPMHEGRGTFVGQREWATRRHLGLLIERGLDAEALALIRRTRSRPLRSLRRFVRLAELSAEDRDVWERTMSAFHAERGNLDDAISGAWQLPAQDLERLLGDRSSRMLKLRHQLDALLARLNGDRSEARPLPEGELALAFHPLVEGWVAIAADDRDAISRRVDEDLDALIARPDGLSERLLAPFAEAIRRARLVRILAYGPFNEVDFHTLPFDGDALLAAKPVVYGVDLETPAVSLGGPARALVVGDPEDNLPGARAEARSVAEALRATGWQVEVLTGQQAAGPTIRSLLGASTLFHYAGHGVFAGWESALPLAERGHLYVDDVLTLTHAPERVVLSGCETGRALLNAPAATIGLAHAFLAAGSKSVVASIRPVEDRDASALVRVLYQALDDGAPVAQALRRAQLELRASSPATAWESFRVMVP